jgi:hypothetical protein
MGAVDFFFVIKICIIIISGMNISQLEESLSAAPVLSCRYKLLHHTNTMIFFVI